MKKKYCGFGTFVRRGGIGIWVAATLHLLSFIIDMTGIATPEEELQDATLAPIITLDQREDPVAAGAPTPYGNQGHEADVS